MIGNRAEIAMVGMLLGPTVDTPAARQLLQDLFVSEADMLPDTENRKLRVKVHAASRPAVNKLLRKLFEELNESEIFYPGTDMQLVYEIPEFSVVVQFSKGISQSPFFLLLIQKYNIISK